MVGELSIFPATLCPFCNDDSIDEAGLRTYARYLASVKGIRGLVCNGHTGEAMSLRNRERADINIIVHQYPSWTKAGYTLKEMLAMTKIPHVVSIKMGTRDMDRFTRFGDNSRKS